MKVYPAPRESNITRKELRRLPHVFNSVLQLPFRSDADVAVEESSDCFRFVAVSDGMSDVRAHIIEIHPGLVKVVVGEASGIELLVDELELELDVWRFRLPVATRPELASAVCINGELIVTVPKDGDEGGFWGGGNGERMGDLGRLIVLVQ